MQCLCYLFPLQESVIHQSLFWVAISVLQLDVAPLYASGLALLEQNLHTLDNQGCFDNEVSHQPFICYRFNKKNIGKIIKFSW